MDRPGLGELVALSRRYGGDPAWVLAGGGNTSFKDATTLWVKASGTALATVDEAGFCAMDRAALDAIWSRDYPAEPAAREAAALADLMAARLPGEAKRPSVETLIHGFFPQAYVVHTHPGLVNGMTCGRDGEAACRGLFADEALWIPLVDPGYVLARAVREAVESYRARAGRVPSLVFMQNHGMLAASDSPRGIEELHASVVARLAPRAARKPDRTVAAVPADALATAMSHIASLVPAGTRVVHRADADILRFAASEADFAPLSSAFSPDHIVYAGHEFARADGPGGVPAAVAAFRGRNGTEPRILLVAGLGAFALGATRVAAEAAMALFLDACAVAVYAEGFGGPLHMPRARIEFIRNWEVESYRAKASLGGGS